MIYKNTQRLPLTEMQDSKIGRKFLIQGSFYHIVGDLCTEDNLQKMVDGIVAGNTHLELSVSIRAIKAISLDETVISMDETLEQTIKDLVDGIPPGTPI